MEGEELGSDRNTLTVPPVDPVVAAKSFPTPLVRVMVIQSKDPGSADSSFKSSNKSASASESCHVEVSGLVTVLPLFNIS